VLSHLAFFTIMKMSSFSKSLTTYLIIISIWLLTLSCDGLKNPFLKSLPSKGHENIPPETYLFLFFKNDTLIQTDTIYNELDTLIVQDTVIQMLDTTSSKQIIHWWGEDPDGEVIGYYYKWNFQDTFTFTTKESDTFYVPIRSAYDVFEFYVKAVDNDSSVDLTPAKIVLPVFNSPPHVEFRLNSNPQAPEGNPNVVAYTFPTRTFVWDATDPDGNNTITEILWALDDTTEWNVIKRDEDGYLPDQLTLTDIEPGYHTFYLKVRDIASAESEVIMFPDTTDDEVPNYWCVKPVLGEVLLVDDFAQDQQYKTTQKYYRRILSEVLDDTFSVWEIGSSSWNVQNSLPYTQIDIEANLNYFKKVIWFSHLGRPHISQAGLAITKYIAKGGKIFITNANEEVPDTTWTFTDIDSVYRLNPGGRLMKGIKVIANFGTEELNEKLTLMVGKLIGNRVSALIPGKAEGTMPVYFMEHSDSTSISVPYKGSPCVAVKYKPDYIEGESIYFSLPLNYCDGYGNVKELMDYILNVEFEEH